MVGLLAKNRWPFRLHATYDETITRALNVYEEVNREVPLQGLHRFIDHAETISQRNMDRIAALGGGIAIQHRMAFQGEYFRDRYGITETKRTPPIREMLRVGLPVGAGTDATRVASYNPFVSLYWLVTGKTVGGLSMYDEDHRFDRMEALRLWTVGSSWLSTEQETKGSIVPGQLADLAVLSADYFSVAEDEIKSLESVLTIVGGKPVYAAEEFAELAPPLPPVLPEWSPVAAFGGYAKRGSPGDRVLASGSRTLPPSSLYRSCVERQVRVLLLGVLERRYRCEHLNFPFCLRRPSSSLEPPPPRRLRKSLSGRSMTLLTSTSRHRISTAS